jgi:DNA-binding MarR family transcriptional regulator
MPASRAGAARNALAAIVELLNDRFADFSFNELTTLLAVCEHEGLSVSSVARVCGFTEATASRNIRRLSPADMPGALAPARGLLTLARAPNDNRSRYVFLTARGRALCETFDAWMADPGRARLISAPPSRAAAAEAR